LGGGGTSTANSSAKFRISGRASGGPVNAGTPYIVGEQGPELLVPRSDGNIIPNNKLGGSSVTITGNTFLSEEVAEKIGDMIIGRLKLSSSL
jgi:hypothetical protein